MSRKEMALLSQFPFLITARPDQKAPHPGISWRNWLFLGGRGAGKTRAGAEWARFSALAGRMERIALVGPTLGDVREVMIEGPSGLKGIETRSGRRPVYNVSRRRLEWPNGAKAYAFSAEDPDSLRGPQFDAAWCDEIAAWSHAEQVWDTLQMGLRLGPHPQCVATTTPRPVGLVKRLVSGEAMVTHAATAANIAFLSEGFVEQVEARYAGTVLGRQELGGELIEDPEGALWSRSRLDQTRVDVGPDQFEDIVVAVDPPATSGPLSDACGIVAAGVAAEAGFGRRCFILADASQNGLQPLDWAGRVDALAREVGASCIIAEANQGGEMISAVLASAGCKLPVRLVRARLGKRARALPVAALYGRGDVSHIGVLTALEDEMCRFGAEGFSGSPDRVDALVWAVTHLMLERAEPRVRRL